MDQDGGARDAQSSDLFRIGTSRTIQLTNIFRFVANYRPYGSWLVDRQGLEFTTVFVNDAPTTSAATTSSAAPVVVDTSATARGTEEKGNVSMVLHATIPSVFFDVCFEVNDTPANHAPKYLNAKRALVPHYCSYNVARLAARARGLVVAPFHLPLGFQDFTVLLGDEGDTPSSMATTVVIQKTVLNMVCALQQHDVARACEDDKDARVRRAVWETLVTGQWGGGENNKTPPPPPLGTRGCCQCRVCVSRRRLASLNANWSALVAHAVYKGPFLAAAPPQPSSTAARADLKRKHHHHRQEDSTATAAPPVVCGPCCHLPLIIDEDDDEDEKALEDNNNSKRKRQRTANSHRMRQPTLLTLWEHIVKKHEDDGDDASFSSLAQGGGGKQKDQQQQQQLKKKKKKGNSSECPCTCHHHQPQLAAAVPVESPPPPPPRSEEPNDEDERKIPCCISAAAATSNPPSSTANDNNDNNRHKTVVVTANANVKDHIGVQICNESTGASQETLMNIGLCRPQGVLQSSVVYPRYYEISWASIKSIVDGLHSAGIAHVEIADDVNRGCLVFRGKPPSGAALARCTFRIHYHDLHGLIDDTVARCQQQSTEAEKQHSGGGGGGGVEHVVDAARQSLAERIKNQTRQASAMASRPLSVAVQHEQDLEWCGVFTLAQFTLFLKPKTPCCLVRLMFNASSVCLEARIGMKPCYYNFLKALEVAYNCTSRLLVASSRAPTLALEPRLLPFGRVWCAWSTCDLRLNQFNEVDETTHPLQLPITTTAASSSIQAPLHVDLRGRLTMRHPHHPPSTTVCDDDDDEGDEEGGGVNYDTASTEYPLQEEEVQQEEGGENQQAEQQQQQQQTDQEDEEEDEEDADDADDDWQ